MPSASLTLCHHRPLVRRYFTAKEVLYSRSLNAQRNTDTAASSIASTLHVDSHCHPTPLVIRYLLRDWQRPCQSCPSLHLTRIVAAATTTATVVVATNMHLGYALQPPQLQLPQPLLPQAAGFVLVLVLVFVVVVAIVVIVVLVVWSCWSWSCGSGGGAIDCADCVSRHARASPY